MERIETLAREEHLTTLADQIKIDLPTVSLQICPRQKPCQMTFTTALNSKTPTNPSNADSTPAPASGLHLGKNSFSNTWNLVAYDRRTAHTAPQPSSSLNPTLPSFRAGVNDYRQLNENTVPDNHPLPRVSDILSDCSKGKVFTVIDMTNSFFQTRVHPDHIKYTAVSTPFWHVRMDRHAHGLPQRPRDASKADVLSTSSIHRQNVPCISRRYHHLVAIRPRTQSSRPPDPRCSPLGGSLLLSKED